MTSLNLELNCTFAWCLSGDCDDASHKGSETQPEVHLFYSANVGNGQVKLVKDLSVTNENDGALLSAEPIAISMPLAESRHRSFGPLAERGVRLLDATETRDTFPLALSICFKAYAMTHNGSGERCKRRIGACRMLVAPLLARIGSHGQNVLVPFEHSVLPFREAYDDDGHTTVKGWVQIKSVRASWTPAKRAVQALFDWHVPHPLPYMIVDINPAPLPLPWSQMAQHQVRTWHKLAANTVDEGLRRFFTDAVMCAAHALHTTRRNRWLPGEPPLDTPSLPSLRSMHTPEYHCDFFSVHGSAYAWRRPLVPSSAAFFEHLARVAARRLGTPLEAIVEVAKSETNYAIYPLARLLGVMLSLVPSSYIYLDDTTRQSTRANVLRKHGAVVQLDHELLAEVALPRGTVANECSVEAMDDMRMTGGDDCEGSAQEAMLEWTELVQLAADDESSALSDALRLLVQLAKHYVPLLVLGGATNASRASTDNDAASQLIAHTFMVLVPLNALARATSSTTFELPAGTLEGARLAAQRAAASAAVWSSLPLILCEGTAASEPLLRPIDIVIQEATQRDEWAQLARQRCGERLALMRRAADEGLFAHSRTGGNVSRFLISETSEDGNEAPYKTGARQVAHFYQYAVSAFVTPTPTPTTNDDGILTDVVLLQRHATAHWSYGVPFYRFIYGLSNGTDDLLLYGYDATTASSNPRDERTLTTRRALDEMLSTLEPLASLEPPPSPQKNDDDSSSFADFWSDVRDLHLSPLAALLMPRRRSTLFVRLDDYDSNMGNVRSALDDVQRYMLERESGVTWRMRREQLAASSFWTGASEKQATGFVEFVMEWK